MDVIRHDYECVERVAILTAVMLEYVKENIRCRLYLEESATVCRNRSYKIRTDFLGREFHRREDSRSGPEGLRSGSHLFMGLKAHAPSARNAKIQPCDASIRVRLSGAVSFNLYTETSP